METPSRYRELAAECSSLASKAETEDHRKILREMVQAFQNLADPMSKQLGLSNPVAGIEHFTSITAVRNSEERAQRLAAIVEWSDDFIVGTDLERRITSWNRGAERLFGYAASEAVGMPIAAIVPEEQRAEEFPIFERFRAGERVGRPGQPVELASIYVQLAAADVSFTAGAVYGASGAQGQP